MQNLSLLLIAASMFSAMAGCAQNVPGAQVASGWVAAKNSQEDPKLWECAGRAASWVVRPSGDGVRFEPLEMEQRQQPAPLPAAVHLSKEMVGSRTILKTRRGWLAGFDAGEFGGGLWWFRADGKEVLKLSERNVHAIYRADYGIRVLVGLDHMGYDEGSVESLVETDSDVKLIDVANIHGSPEASVLYGEDILIATPASVIRVNPAGDAKVLYQGRRISIAQGKILASGDSGDSLIYPTSIESNRDGDIFVAMRFFVLRLARSESGYKSEWLMPKQCSSFHMKQYVCVCGAK